MGRKDAPSYRIVVAESSMPRDGRFVDNLGHYNPRTEPKTLVVDREKALRWLANGATPTDTARALLKRAGVFRPAPAESPVSAAVEAVKGAAAKVADVAKDAVEAVRDAAEEVRERVAGGEEEEQPAAETAAEEPAAPAEPTA